MLDDDEAWGDCVFEGLSRGERQVKTKGATEAQRNLGNKRKDNAERQGKRAGREPGTTKAIQGQEQETTEQSSEDMKEI